MCKSELIGWLVLKVLVLLLWIYSGESPRADASDLGEPFVISAEVQHVESLSRHLSLFIDNAKEASISEIMEGRYDSRFVLNRRPIASAGFTDATVWVRFEVENRAGEEVSLLVESAMARLTHATWYLVKDSTVVKTVHAGAVDWIDGKKLVHQYPQMEFAMLPKSSVSIYLRAESDTAIWFLIHLATETEFRRFDRLRLMHDLLLVSICAMISLV